MFDAVDPKQDFVQLEHEIIKFWKKNKILEKYLKKNQKAKKRWSFLDGPITANNPMGVHHAWGRTLKDLWQRFFTMRGFQQRYQNGFDCQGLWVEVEVEKELGFKSKKDIERYGLDKFVQKCKERVYKYSKIQTEQSLRLAEWMDWDHSYYTLSEKNNYTIWHFLKVCHQNGWIYKGTDSVPWCPRCGTAISQHEILTEEYQELTHRAVYLKFQITNSKFQNKYLLVWTTTPWTIPANVAIAVDPQKEYLLTKSEKGEDLIILADRFETIFGRKISPREKKIAGRELLGLAYSGPYDHLPLVKKTLGSYQHRVVASDPVILPVSTEEGTGLVHIAPGAGTEDFALGKKEKLPILALVDEAAVYLEGLDWLSGLSTSEVSPKILEDLKKRGFSYQIEDYTHRYPTCWRCKTELVWRNVAEWYIEMDKSPKTKDQRLKTKNKTFRERMIQVAKKIKWIPEWGLDRELDWLNNMHDWLISKKRYWGLALPIWQCQCGYFEVIGSEEELKKKAIEGWDQFEGHSPHRPWIDKIKINCPQCGQKISRIPDVGNPWLDAGVVPFSTYLDPETKKVSYLTDKKYWRQWFPADFITECFPGQFKNWFYTLIAMSTALENTHPFKTLLGHALVRDEKGEEMHKSRGNAIEFFEAAERMGVDVMRWMYLRQNSVINLNFGYGPAREVLRRFILMLWNCYSFFITYANVDHWKPQKQLTINSEQLTILDRWILVRLDELINVVTKHLKEYNSYQAAEEIEKFVDDLSTWYLRRSRKRRDEAFYHTMYKVLLILSKLFAPFIPHISEAIYRNLRRDRDPESVHLSSWPVVNKRLIDKKLLSQMQKAREIVEKTHALRAEAGIKVRQPLRKLQIPNYKLPNELLQIIAEEVNVKEAIVDPRQKQEVILETKITPELKKEGIAREIIRQIQFLRKKAHLSPQDKINLYLETKDKTNQQAIEKYQKKIQNETVATKILDRKPIKIIAEIKTKDLFIGISNED